MARSHIFRARCNKCKDIKKYKFTVIRNTNITNFTIKLCDRLPLSKFEMPVDEDAEDE